MITVVHSFMWKRGPLSVTSTAPFAPVSDAPNASMIATFGARSLSSCLIDGERIAPPETSANSDGGAARCASASTSGRAIASPTSEITFTFSRSTRSQISSASKRRLALSVTVLPPNSATNIDHCALPCMSGASARLTPGVRADVLHDVVGVLDAGAAVVPAAHRREEDVLGAPHHALRHAGRAARVEDVEVVGRAGEQAVAVGRRRRERVLVVDRVEPGGHGAGAVVELHEVPQLRHAGQDRRDVRTELGLEDQRDEVGVVEEVAQLLDDVAVVHVDRHRAGLEAAEHRLDPLGPVERVDADVLAGQHADVAQVVRDPVRPLVELAVGEAAVAGDRPRCDRARRRRRPRTGRQG